MSTIRWFFGPSGFMVDIINGEGNQSQVSGQMAAADMDIKIDFIPSGVVPATGVLGSTATGSQVTSFTPMQTEPGVPGGVQTDLYPFAVRANVSLEDEGIVEAEWQVYPNRISGKGTGKGMGKRITPFRSGPY